MIVITTAMREEANAVVAGLMEAVPVPAVFPTWRAACGGEEVTVVCTGIGREAVTAGLAGKLDGATALISAGFAGALTANAAAGDLVLCETVMTEGEGEARRADADLLARAERCGVPPGKHRLKGTGITVPVAARGGSVKLHLRERTGADICEMEDYWAAGLAAARETPFLAVRVVLDELTTDVGDLTDLVDLEGVRLGKAIGYFLTHPGRIGTALRSWRELRRARSSLRWFAERFLGEPGAGR